MIIILILIPIISIGLVSYLMTLYNYIITNELDTLVLIISLFICIVLSFILFKEINKLDKNNYKLYNFKNKSDIYHSYFCIILLFIFGLSLLINYFTSNNLANIIVGLFSITIFITITYLFIFDTKKIPFKIISISTINKKIYLITLESKTYGLKEYYSNTNNYKKNKLYNCKYNINTKSIDNILEEVDDNNE